MFSLIQTVDENILMFVQNHLRLEFLNPLVIAISHLGDAGIFWILLALTLAIIPKTRKYGILGLLSLTFCFLINNVLLKNLVARPRPYTQMPDLIMLMQVPRDHSFPSGHSCSSFAMAMSLWWTVDDKWKKVKICAVILAVLIALSRIYVGVHYPSDVIVGTLIGVIGSYLTCRLFSSKYDSYTKRLRRH